MPPILLSKVTNLQITIQDVAFVMLGKLARRHFGGNDLRAELSRGALGSVLLKIISTLLSLLLAIVLARMLGPAGYGTYTYVFALVSLLAISAQIGLPSLVVRETAKAHATKQWGTMRGLWRWSSLAVSMISVLLALLGLGICGLVADRFTSTQLNTFVFGLVLVPLVALGDLRGAALRGLRRVVIGQLPEFVLRPGILILLIWAGSKYLAPAILSPSLAMGLNAAAALLAFAIGATMLWRTRPIELATMPQPEYAMRAWLAAAFPLALVSGMQLINQNTDIIMLGLFNNAEEVGVYKVVVTCATLVAFGLQTINMVITPHFARLHAQGDRERLQRLATMSARAILIFALPVVLILEIFGDKVLLYMFGKEYISGQVPLAILAIGQLVNAGMGSVGSLLTMTGHERDTARGVVIAAIVNVILNLIFIPLFGITGAAVVAVITLIVWNILLWRAVHRRLGIESMAFSLFTVKTVT
jgi:O-antigen/teichoic acid export membrane protein